MLDIIPNNKAANDDRFQECDFEEYRQYEALSVTKGMAKRVWLHRYYVGKFAREEHVRVYNTQEAAKAQQAVLGGTVTALLETGLI
ncbi:hypothetical protein [Escherichia phage vB_EcoP_PAS7]|uniref:Uncharacterized protein n=1 Tax=Escherichia phage vB_EcoP_PAS7 TaxID=3053875 RepID=A0AA51VII3_9CAUD|nr:hypothetical protein [Escherichia phage vB_EcoP_PAS7]